MGRSRFLVMLLVCAIFAISLPQGDGRRVKLVRHYGSWASPLHENPGVERELVEMVMDYQDPGPNMNTKNGYMFFNPPPSPSRN